MESCIVMASCDVMASCNVNILFRTLHAAVTRKLGKARIVNASQSSHLLLYSIDVDLWSLRLRNSQITKVTKDRIFSLAIAPVTDKVLVLAGDKWGKIGIWDIVS